MRRRFVALGIAVAFLLLAWSAAAASSLAAPGDFAPFVLTKEVWNASLSSEGAGTEVFRIEYRSRNDWDVTEVSHTARPELAGTRWSYRASAFTFFDALRSVTTTKQAEVTVDRWIAPGLATQLASSGAWRPETAVPASVLGLRLNEGGTPRRETLAQFDRATGLPVQIDVFVGTELVQRFTYRRIG